MEFLAYVLDQRLDQVYVGILVLLVGIYDQNDVGGFAWHFNAELVSYAVGLVAVGTFH